MAKEKIQSFRVIKEFTLDKLYRIGTRIELSNIKIIEKLITNKFIK